MNKISIYNKVAAVTNSPSAAPSAHMAHAESAEYAKAASLRPQLAAAPSVFSRMASTSEASATLCSLRPLRETKKSARENPRLTKSQRPIANSLFRKAATFIFALSSFTLITSCTEDDLVTQTTPLAPQGTKTVTVDFQLPEGKPGFEGQSTDNGVQSTDNRVQSTDNRVQSTNNRVQSTDNGVQSTDNRVQSTDNRVQSTDSRGQIAETSAATDGLCTLYSELCTLNATRSTTASWAEGDELMMTVDVSDNNNNFAYAYLTLKYDGSAWDVVTDKSYARIILNNAATNYTYAAYPLLDDITDLSLAEGLTLVLDEAFGEVTIYSVNATYAPELERNGVDNTGIALLKLKANATTTAPESWSASASSKDASLTLQWNANQARLRVHTGVAGDVVTLTSQAFLPNDVVTPADGIYTATTDSEGNAYFYGEAGSYDESDNPIALTSGFNLSLTAVTVGEGDAAFTYPIAPVTLLEASTLVPVQLEAGKSYCLDATEKRTAVSNTITVIDGASSSDDITTAIKAGKTTLYVTGEEVDYIGSAISDSEAADGSINLILADATAIGEYAFFECSALKSVSAPKATSIGGYAFTQCSALESVSAPKVTSIGINAFDGCSALTSVSLPDVKEIGMYAFSGCTALTSVSLPAATTIGNEAFYGCAALTSVSLPAATSIGDGAFTFCTALASVSLPAATTIGGYAFANCTSLTSLTFGSVITSVGEYAFYDVPTTTCDLTLNSGQLSSTDLKPSGNTWADETWASIRYVDDEGNAVTVIDGAATEFYASAQISDALAAGQSTIYVTGELGIGLQNAIFIQANGSIDLVLPDATTIGNIAFNDCTALTSVSAPSATSIGEHAFDGCAALESVSLPAATTIGNFAFNGCAALESVSAPKATSIGNYAFQDCTSLTSLTFGTVTSVGTNAFYSVPTTTCDLTLGTGSIDNPEAGENKTWAGKNWASIRWSTNSN